MKITIELTPSEKSLIDYGFVDFDFYINSIAEGQFAILADEIKQKVVNYCIDNNKQIPLKIDEMVELAYADNVIEKASDRAFKVTTPSETSV